MYTMKLLIMYKLVSMCIDISCLCRMQVCKSSIQVTKVQDISKSFFLQLFNKIFSNCWQNKVGKKRQEEQDGHIAN